MTAGPSAASWRRARPGGPRGTALEEPGTRTAVGTELHHLPQPLSSPLLCRESANCSFRTLRAPQVALDHATLFCTVRKLTRNQLAKQNLSAVQSGMSHLQSILHQCWVLGAEKNRTVPSSPAFYSTTIASAFPFSWQGNKQTKHPFKTFGVPRNLHHCTGQRTIHSWVWHFHSF